MNWIHRNSPRGFEDLSLAEMKKANLKQVSNRYFHGDNFNLGNSAYGQFTIKELSRGFSPEEAIKNIKDEIPSPYRMEKFADKKRKGSTTFALLAEKYHGGDICAVNPKSIILVFTPNNSLWITGYVTEKKNSLVQKLQDLPERTCTSLTSKAALAMVNISGSEALVDPCCGTGMIPLASKLLGRETYAADNNLNMLRMARGNRDSLGIDLEILKKDALEPWVEGCCLVTDFPADRAWNSTTEDLSLVLFNIWIPHIKSFCVIFPNQILKKLPKNISIDQKIKFTANRTIVVGKVL
ncbi:MAG: hypothetical protein JXR48_10180 [Candidatus Delongbacteria bacterium]|nr:hypothetical protein [Candidatus Delongbacteria bacterium]MBN2835322.1 hypothetical protein [Candidatus Delongbacteria bacterium]